MVKSALNVTVCAVVRSSSLTVMLVVMMAVSLGVDVKRMSLTVELVVMMGCWELVPG